MKYSVNVRRSCALIIVTLQSILIVIKYSAERASRYYHTHTSLPMH